MAIVCQTLNIFYLIEKKVFKANFVTYKFSSLAHEKSQAHSVAHKKSLAHSLAHRIKIGSRKNSVSQSSSQETVWLKVRITVWLTRKSLAHEKSLSHSLAHNNKSGSHEKPLAHKRKILDHGDKSYIYIIIY